MSRREVPGTFLWDNGPGRRLVQFRGVPGRGTGSQWFDTSEEALEFHNENMKRLSTHQRPAVAIRPTHRPCRVTNLINMPSEGSKS